MKATKALLLLACGVMDLSWHYAWAIFLTGAVLHQPFPFPEAVGAFVLAAVLTRLTTGRGWRVIYIVALQAVFFIPLFLRVVDIFHSWSRVFAEQRWITDSFFNATASQDWFIFMLILLWIFPFWGGGIRLGLRHIDYLMVCSRFDRGLVAFFVLLLVKFIFLDREGIRTDLPVFEYLVFSFFLASLLAIGLVRNASSTGERGYLPGYQGVGAVVSFTVVLLLLCAALTFFCMPYLTMAAQASYVLMKEGARPVGSFLLMILRFIFGSSDDWKTKMPEKKATQRPKLDSSSHYSWWVELFGTIIAWIAWIVLAAVFVLIIGTILYFFVQWLFSKTASDQDGSTPRHPLPPWLQRLRNFFHPLWKRFLLACIGYTRALHIYAALQSWGRRSGLPCMLSETPSEYGSRLRHRFPLLAKEIELIVQSFHREVYGDRELNEQQLSGMRSAWVKLRSPLQWPRRIRTWFFRRQGENKPTA